MRPSLVVMPLVSVELLAPASVLACAKFVHTHTHCYSYPSVECTELVLCPQALHPAQHAELKARLQEGQARRRIERALDALSAALSARGLAADLSGRPKNLWGVFGKMAAKGYGLESVYDVRALRVIVSSKADCYEALRQVWTDFGTPVVLT